MTTIKEHCCGADLFFNKRKSDRLYKAYLKKGPTRITAKMISQLEGQHINGKSLIDVGGGVGALQWWFLENGGKNTVDIDASSGYLKQAKQHALNKGWESKTEFLLGDCVDVFSSIKTADFITLDKVVCCYPNYKEILEVTCDKASRVVSLSYPLDGFISNLIRIMGDLLMRFTNNPFRPFIHSVEEIRNVFKQKNYERVAYNLTFPWHVETYVKQEVLRT